MPFKSEAQRRRYQKLLGQGIITQEQYDKMAKDTPLHLPERTTKKGPATKRPMRIK